MRIGILASIWSKPYDSPVIARTEKMERHGLIYTINIQGSFFIPTIEWITIFRPDYQLQ